MEGKPKIEPPARLVEAAKNVIASTTALAASASATVTQTEAQKAKAEKERLRLKEKKKRAKEKKRLEKKAQEEKEPPKQAEVKTEEPKKKKKEEGDEAKAAKSVVADKPKEASKKEEKKKEGKKKAVDELTDVLGIPLRPQLAKLLNVSESQLDNKLTGGVALVRNGTHVLAFARAEQSEGFAIVLDAVGEKVHKQRVVAQLVGEAKSAKKNVLVSQALSSEISLKGSAMFVQIVN